MQNKIVYDFLRRPVFVKVSIFLNILANLKDNPDFENPDIPFDQVQAAIDDLLAAQKATLNGGHSSIVKLHVTEEAADKAFRKLGRFVERKSNGVESVIVSIGFPVRKIPVIHPKPDIDLKVGLLPGTIDCMAHAIRGAGAYVWFTAVGTIPDTKKEWITTEYSKTTKVTLSGFTPGTILYVTCAGITSDGLTPMYQPVQIVVE